MTKNDGNEKTNLTLANHHRSTLKSSIDKDANHTQFSFKFYGCWYVCIVRFVNLFISILKSTCPTRRRIKQHHTSSNNNKNKKYTYTHTSRFRHLHDRTWKVRRLHIWYFCKNGYDMCNCIFWNWMITNLNYRTKPWHLTICFLCKINISQ